VPFKRYFAWIRLDVAYFTLIAKNNCLIFRIRLLRDNDNLLHENHIVASDPIDILQHSPCQFVKSLKINCSSSSLSKLFKCSLQGEVSKKDSFGRLVWVDRSDVETVVKSYIYIICPFTIGAIISTMIILC